MEEDKQNPVESGRKLLLACGNSLRGDDGVGWKIAEAVEVEQDAADVKVIITQQFTPELAEAIRDADTVVFVDAAANTAAGEVTLLRLTPAAELPRLLTHHMPPDSLLTLTQDLYGKLPARAFAVTVGGASFELGETITETVAAAIPRAVAMVRKLLTETV
jgi:hydrogenase maturation protease